MNFIKRIFLILFLLIFSISIVKAELIVTDLICSDTGYLSFELNYKCIQEDCIDDARKRFSKINITAESGGQQYSIEVVNKPKFLAEFTYYNLISKDDNLEPNRDYNLIFFDGEERTEYSVTCPEFKFGCSKIDLKIDYCSEQESDFLILFHGLANQFSYTELREELNYYINPARSTYGFKPSEELPDNFKVNSLGSDRYVLQVPILDLNNQFLDSIYIKVKDCDINRYSISDFSSCKKQDCNVDGNCPVGSYCDLDNNKCKILVCSACETLSNNQCISTCKPRNICEEATCGSNGCEYTKKENCCLSSLDCNDGLVCTQDTCNNNICTNKKIECKASGDTCIVGVCEEPNGCKYIPDPECDKKEEIIQEEDIKEEVKEVKKVTQIKITETLKSVLGPIVKNEKLSFNFLGEEYTIVSEDVGKDYVDLQIGDKSERINVKGKKEIDIDGDGINDLTITLKDIDNGRANLEFSKIEGTKKSSLFIMVVVLVIILLVGGGGFLLIKNKNKPSKKEIEPIGEEIIKKPTSDKPISISNFTLKHGKNIILENVSLDVDSGDMVCLLGPSGTGKSTIIEALVGRKTPTKGTLRILGKDIAKNKKIFEYVGFVPQHAELYLNQTVMQNLLSSATKWGIKDAKNKSEKILIKIDLSNKKELKASKLSGGQQKLLSLGMELIRDIEVCILDEPTTGLDPNTRNNVITILSQICTQLHKTIFFTTHFMDDAEQCDKVIILAGKKIVAQGPPLKLEKSLPGGGNVVNIILDNVTDDLLDKIGKIQGVKKIVREGRNLKILTDQPNAIKMGQSIDEIGGVINETKIDKVTMMEVFVYYTGKEPEK